MEEISRKTLSVFFQHIKKGIFGRNKWKRNEVSFHSTKDWPGKKAENLLVSFLDTDEKDTLYLFDSFGIYGLLNFIVKNDLDVFKRVIPRQIKYLKKNNKITLLKWSFKLSNYKKLKQKQLDQFTPAASLFFKFLYNFGKYKKIKNTAKVDTVDNNLRLFDTDYCGPFEMYLCFSLFEPLKGSVVVESSSKKLNVKERCWTKYSTPKRDRRRRFWMPSYFSMTTSFTGNKFA